MEPAIQKKLDAFFSQYKQQKFRKGEILIRADSQPSGILYLTKGTVKQYAISAQGVEQILTIYKPYSFFPMMWAINNTSNTHYFEALSEVMVWNAPKDAVVTFIKGDSDILYDLLGRLYRGMGTLLSRIEYFMTGSAYQKVIFTILNTAARFGEKRSETDDVILHTTHKEIAAFSGLTKETISRESKKLQERGLIENRNHIIIIKNMRKLEAELLHSASH